MSNSEGKLKILFLIISNYSIYYFVFYRYPWNKSINQLIKWHFLFSAFRLLFHEITNVLYRLCILLIWNVCFMWTNFEYAYFPVLQFEFLENGKIVPVFWVFHTFLNNCNTSMTIWNNFLSFWEFKFQYEEMGILWFKFPKNSEIHKRFFQNPFFNSCLFKIFQLTKLVKNNHNHTERMYLHKLRNFLKSWQNYTWD